ncbi:CASP3 [Branchiostoma lanceolatum]|uniref:CASP3 protein n=1 Tax=Branchiostoma lanceolatum TaxID=7740 RepID=A0A8J9ZIF7_BRALA|nr:CASP3 [Branchiostoma lanceolatum]
MGLYIRQTVKHNDRCVYKHEARDQYIFYWKDTQQWLVGPDYTSYERHLYVDDKHVLPEDITGIWRVKSGKGKGWVKGKTVKLQLVEARQPAGALLLTGITQHQTSLMGLYLLQTDDDNQPVYHDNRPVYKHEAKGQYIYFKKDEQRWWVGTDITKAWGGLCVEDSHVLPEDITVSWKVAPRWVEDGNVTLQPAPTKQPAAALLLTGITQHSTSCMGLYLLMTDEHNQPLFSGSRPVYKHEAKQRYIYFWKTTQKWWVGSDIDAACGWLNVEDSNVLPEDIRGTWNVSTGERFVEDSNAALQAADTSFCTKSDEPPLQASFYTKATEPPVQVSFYSEASRPPFLGGVAVIINNINFSHDSRRVGAEEDTGKVKRVFEKFGLSVDIRTDKTAEEMLSIVRDQGQADHSGHGCFVCCIMTHGDHGKVCGTDGNAIDILKLVNLVSGHSCLSLVGKPKVFIVQACQGGDKQGALCVDSATPFRNIGAFISNDADLYIGLATVPGYVAYRSPTEGGEYINKVVQVLTREGQKQDLLTMMTIVNEEMNNDYGRSPFYCSTLRKKLYFVLPKP